MPGPLANVRVLDMSRILAGPWATQLLADLVRAYSLRERCRADPIEHWRELHAAAKKFLR